MGRATARILREARQGAGITQAELARRVGVTQPMIAVYESGSREPSAANFRRILRALGLRVSLQPARERTFPDPERASRIFLDLLDWLDQVPAPSRPKSDLGFPVMAGP